MRADLKRHGFRWLVAGVALFALAAPRPAAANFHFMLIVEMFAGSAAAPDAQYVVLQMYSSGQTVLGGHPMRFYDAAGNELLPAANFGTIANGADDARILIATSTAEALFGVAADLLVPAKLPMAGGKVCFDTVDCFAWEGYSALPDSSVGTPFGDFTDDVSAVRLYDLPLDALDDTDDSELDFQSEGLPSPRNNAGAVGFRSQDALLLDGFEDGSFTGWTGVVTPSE